MQAAPDCLRPLPESARGKAPSANGGAAGGACGAAGGAEGGAEGGARGGDGKSLSRKNVVVDKESLVSALRCIGLPHMHTCQPAAGGIPSIPLPSSALTNSATRSQENQ